MTTSNSIEPLLRESGAFLEGHFLLTSGMHSPHYYEKFRLLENPEYNTQVSRSIADRFCGSKIDAVAGAAIGGILLAYEVARQFGVRCLFAERVEGDLRFRRGFSLSQNERVLLVEDIVTTGGSVTELLDLCRTTGAEIEGIGLLVDRSNGRFKPDVNWHALYTAEVKNYTPDACPQCAGGMPLTSRGRSGKEK